MSRIGDIHTFEDKRFLTHTARMSGVVFAGGAVLTIGLFVALGLLAPGALDPAFQGLWVPGGGTAWPEVCWLLGVGAGSLASLVLHEVVHAVFFKAYAPRGARVTFGANWKLGMLYACAEGIVYPRRRYIAIALAPSIAVSAAAIAVGWASGCPVGGCAVAVIHLSGCTGDWGYLRAIRANKRIAYCEDTSWGVAFYDEHGPSKVEDGEDSAARVDEPALRATDADTEKIPRTALDRETRS